MNSFAVSITQSPGAAAQAQQRPEAAWQTGQTISALFEGLSGSTAMFRAGDGTVFTADASSVSGQVGESLNFWVQRTRTGFKLRQVADEPVQKQEFKRGVSTALDAFRGAINSLEAMQETDELREEHRQEQAAKVAKAISSIRRAQSFQQGTNRKSAVSAMVKSGIDISKVSFADFNRVMTHADKSPSEDMSAAELKQNLEKEFKQPENAKDIVTSLYKHGMNVSDKNISALENAWEKMPEKVEAPVIEKLVADERELTLDNVYKSKYSAAPKPPVSNPGSWEALQGALKRLFAREGVAETPTNLDAARFLLDRDLPLTRKNIERVLFLEGMTANVLREAFFDRAASHMASDSPIGSMNLPDLAAMAEQQMKLAVQTAGPLGAPGGYGLPESDAQRYLRMVGGDFGPAPAARMAQLYSRLTNISPLTVNVHGSIAKGLTPFTIDGIHESVQMARAQSQYEQHATVPNPRYGDSFERVRGMFAPLLEDMKIRPTTENLKASFILSKNDMDVNKDNLQAVKEIEAKISAMADKLHPVIAASMLKEGLNPLEMHVDQVLAYIMKFNMDKGKDVSGKVAQYIMEMDENKSIDADTRKSMIALYRMLHIIQKDGAAALGLAAELGTDLTLGEMMDMAKNFKKIRAGEAVDISVNESFANLRELLRPEGSIRGALENTAKSDGTWPLSNMGLAMDRFLDAVAPKKLEALLASKEGLQQAVEDIAANAGPAPGMPPNGITKSAVEAAYAAEEQRVTEQIQAFIAANPEIVHFLQSRGITATVGHIKALEKLTRSHRALAEELEAAERYLDEENELSDAVSGSSLQELREGTTAGQIIARLFSAVSRATPGRTATGITSLLTVTHGLNGDGRQGFQLPVKINGRIANLQLYVLNERALTEDGARVLLSLDTERLGMVTAYFTTSADELDIVVTVQTPEAVAALTAEENGLRALLAELGIEEASIQIALDRQPALETSLPPDALQQWSNDSMIVQNLTQSNFDIRV